MSLLRSIESRIARLVEGGIGRVVRSQVQPVELARRLVREMDDHQRTSSGDGTAIVPDRYDVSLSASDHACFDGVHAALAAEFADYLADHARRNGYTLASRPRVNLIVADELPRGSVNISATSSAEALILVTPDSSVPLAGERLTIGREDSNSIVVHDASVSREHAVLEQLERKWILRDLGSTNGTRVHGSPVRRHVVADGDIIRVGNVDLHVRSIAEDHQP